MKKFVAIIILLSALGLPAMAQTDATAPDPNAPVLTFDTEVIDYGTLTQGSDAVRTFKFTNTGKSPLIITSIKGQCGCTSVSDSPTAPIAPGASGSFQVKYDTSIRIGAFDKKVTIISNASASPKDVKIKGVVVAAPGSGN